MRHNKIWEYIPYASSVGSTILAHTANRELDTIEMPVSTTQT